MSESISIRVITAETVRRITDLTVAPHQRHLVATNAESLAEALFCPEAWYRAVYFGEEPVGFVMLYDESLRAEPPPQARTALWRFMIDHRHQGRGFGAIALKLIIEQVRERSPAPALELSYVLGQDEPSGFYRRLGFLDTERWDGGERVMVLPLRPITADRCPLCGAPNDCAVSACGRFDVDCWCAQLTIDPTTLARVPEPLKGRACLCRACATGAARPPSEPT